MYVAITRARRKVFIVTEDGQESAFVLELEGSKKAISQSGMCRDCGGEIVERSGPHGPFFGCNNFPKCTYKVRTQKRAATSGLA